MKVSYKFLNELKNFLISDDWTVELKSRIEVINEELKITPEKNLENKINNAKPRNDKQKNWKVENIFNEESKNKIIESHKTQLEKLSQEKTQIEFCLKNDSYMLGIAPFDDINNTKLLLANIHLLDLKLSDKFFNEKAVVAIKNMFKKNFDKLYDLKVSNIAGNNVGHLAESKTTLFMNKIIENKELKLEDIFEAFGENENQVVQEVILNTNEAIINQAENVQEFKEMAPKLLSFYKALDPKMLEYSYNLMQFINQFYMNGHGHDGGFAMLATQLAFCFAKIEDIDNFLEKEVNFESFQTIENTIALIGLEFFEATELSFPEIKIWREINGKYGKEAIKLFVKAGDLKSAGFDIYKFAQTNAIEDVYKKAQEVSETLEYKDEESHKELAKLMHEYNYPEKIFDKVVKEILPHQKKDDLIPNISFKMTLPKKGEFTFSKLKPGALDGLFLGKKSYSCQSIESDGEKCAIDGFTRKDAGFYVFSNKKGEIIAQSYAWIGQNKNGEDVLVLDSYEYVPLPAYKELFLMAMKELEVKIKNFGFSELYVGCGGRTPKLNSEQLHDEVKPKDKGLFQYYDSKSVYKITGDICLKEDNDSDILIEYKDFDEFYAKNQVLNWDKIIRKNDDSEESLVIKHSIVIHHLKNSQLLKYLIQKQIIPFEIIASMGQKCFMILPDTHALSLKIRIELIEEIFIANKNIEDAFKLINEFSQIHPSLAKEMNPKELIAICSIFEYGIPTIISNHAQLNGVDKETQEIALKVAALGIEKFGFESGKIVNILNNLSSINKEVINTCSLQKILEICSAFEYIPSILSYSDSDALLKLALCAFEENKDNIEKFSETCVNLKSLDPLLLDLIEPKILVEFCSNVKYMPYEMLNLNENIINEKSKDFISSLFNKYCGNFDVICKVVNSLFLLDQEVFKETNNVQLIEVLAMSDYMPSLLNAFSVISSSKRLELVKELFKFSPEIILKICNTKLAYNFDIQEVNQIPIYAEECEKETLGDLNAYN